MLYGIDFAIPANTTQAIPLRQKFILTEGIITRFIVFLPWGCGGLCGLRVLRNEQQLFPISHSTWIIGNDSLYEFADDFSLDTEPYTLMLEGYNLDDTYQHTLEVKAIMTRKVLPQKVVDLFAWLAK